MLFCLQIPTTTFFQSSFVGGPCGTTMKKASTRSWCLIVRNWFMSFLQKLPFCDTNIWPDGNNISMDETRWCGLINSPSIIHHWKCNKNFLIKRIMQDSSKCTIVFMDNVNKLYIIFVYFIMHFSVLHLQSMCIVFALRQKQVKCFYICFDVVKYMMLYQCINEIMQWMFTTLPILAYYLENLITI